jgi:PPOX class probable F420-dependent enzyme
MKLDAHARALIGSGADATLVTLNPDGSPQVSVVWIALRTTPDGDDEIVTAHLAEHKKVRNVRRDNRVALTVLSPDRGGPMTPYRRSPAPRASKRAAQPICCANSPRR